MQAVNPYLPSNEYIPDAEPYLFGDRVYVYGSHDRFNAPMFCMNDYVCWSAPVTDLAEWRFEGVIYRKKQDPMNRLGLRLLFAPDVVRGLDDRYYLYYALDFLGVMGVAVCDTPAGKYEFYGHVRFADGCRWGSKSGDEMPFDPSVLIDDDGKIYLYSGFATKVPLVFSRMHNLNNSGCSVLELEQDMLTIKKGPQLILPREGNGVPDDFMDHAYFEASSIRKIAGMYYLVYSSCHNHELCYAISSMPTGNFSFGGTLISIGDIFLNGNKDEGKARNYLGNTHGGLLNIEDRWYIFYHRQTNRHSYSRQACAERIQMTAEGKFLQAEVTSCGLNDGPLRGVGKYPAAIACNLWSKNGVGRYDRVLSSLRLRRHPYFTQNAKDGDADAVQYITNMCDGAVAGFKYFSFQDVKRIKLSIGGRCYGCIQISDRDDFSSIEASIPVIAYGHITTAEGKLDVSNGIRPLYFQFIGKGKLDFFSFELA